MNFDMQKRHSNYRRFRRLFAAAFVAFAALCFGGEQKQAGAQAVVANGGGGFSAFYRQTQMRLLSSLDDALAAKAEEALFGDYVVVRRAEVDVQTKIGGRKGHLGVNLVGAIADSDHHSIGWQLRGYAGQEDKRGGNAGLFFRRITQGGVFLGGNIFADYERHDSGAFLRYSLGGELRHKLFSFAANYYAPITGERDVGGATVAFSRGGYDAKLRVNVPRLQMLKAGADYYHFDGKHSAADDKGFRYALELHPSPALRIGVFYDNDAKQAGGEMAYSRTIGKAPRRAADNENATLDADLFSAVWREHAQRIRLATVAGRRNPGGQPFEPFVPVTVNITQPLAGQTLALYQAAQQGNTASIAAILAAGVDVNTQNYFGSAPLHQAAHAGHPAAVALLISAGARVNQGSIGNFGIGGGWTPLHHAAAEGRLAVMTVLFSANAEVNARDAGGGAPLHNAAINGWDGAVAALLAANANVNLRNDNGETPLHLVTRPTSPDVSSSALAAAMRVLVTAAGVNLNVGDNRGYTPLHDAVDQGRLELVNILLAAGANANATEQDNFTPLDFAIGSNDGGSHDAIISALTANDGRCGLLQSESCPGTTNLPPPPDNSRVVITVTETQMVAPSRVASVQFTTRGDNGGGWLLITTRHKILMTLPPATTARPHVLTVMRNFTADVDGIANPARIVDSNNSALMGLAYAFTTPFNGVRSWTITIVQGSEEIVGTPTTTTLTTRTTTTISAGAATTITTSVIITPAANAAMATNSKMPNFPPPDFPPKAAPMPPLRTFAANLHSAAHFRQKQKMRA